MIKDIIKIIQIYIKKYFVAIIILLVGFSLLAATTTTSHINSLKSDVAIYDFNQKIGNEKGKELRKITSEDEVGKKLRELEEQREQYVKNYNEKLTKEKLAEITHRYAVGVYFNTYPMFSRSSFFEPREDINVIVGANNDTYKKYLTKEELANEYKYDEFRKIEPGSAKYFEKLAEIDELYPSFGEGNNLISRDFAKENLDSNKLQLRETLYSDSTNIAYYILMVLIPLLIFGVEYHTNFGKFISSLPFKKERIYFAKVIVSLLILLLSYIVVGLTNVIVVRGGFLGSVYNFLNTFTVMNKVYILGITLVLLGAIFASFCGSILTLGAMYIPALLFQFYPVAIVILIGRMYNADFLINHEFSETMFAPVFLYFTYVEWKYIIAYLVVLVILTITMSKVYLVHNVEREGEFFTLKIVDVVMYIILLLGVGAFAIFVISGIFQASALVATIITVLLVPYLMWKVSKLRLRV